jgi:hypothetical protein
MPFPALPTQVTCPQCGKAFVVQVRSIIDVGEEPELKEQFLRGRINYAECPQCHTGGVLSTPLIYHDPEKQLLVSYVPAELALPGDQQEQLVGSLVNAVMSSVRQEERKAYFLQPKTALTLEGLYDAVLEAEGFSREILQAQRRRLQLVNTLLTNLDDEKTLDQLVEEHRGEINYEFLLTLSDLIDRHREEGTDQQAERVEKLRRELLKRVDLTPPRAAPQDASYDDLIKMLQETEPGAAWRQTVALNLARLDYGFFQALTARIEAARGAGDTSAAEKLIDLRRRLLEELDSQRRVAREAEDEASLLIMSLSEAEDLAAAVRENADEIDPIFFAVLMRYIETARARNNEARLAKLTAVLDAVTEMLEEQLPPEERLINRLARAEYPDGTGALLEAHRGLLNQDLVNRLDQYIESLPEDEEEALRQHLADLRGQILAKMTVLRG